MIIVTAAPSTTKLIALADFKDMLGISGSASDALIGATIQRASDAIESYLNRKLALQTVTETLPGKGTPLLKLSRNPVTTLTSIKYKGQAIDPAKYVLTEPQQGIIYAETGWFFTGHAYDYEVVYQHGYNLPDMAGTDTLPYDIQQAALELCKSMWTSRKRDGNVTQESIPDVYSRSFASGAGAAGQMPASAVGLLAPYREFRL